MKKNKISNEFTTEKLAATAQQTTNRTKNNEAKRPSDAGLKHTEPLTSSWTFLALWLLVRCKAALSCWASSSEEIGRNLADVKSEFYMVKRAFDRYLPNVQAGSDGLLGRQVETFNVEGFVGFGDEHRVETDHQNGRDEEAGRVDLRKKSRVSAKLGQTKEYYCEIFPVTPRLCLSDVGSDQGANLVENLEKNLKRSFNPGIKSFSRSIRSFNPIIKSFNPGIKRRRKLKI
uniref:Uncharacterized protein n=1 Tax=Romanomermis culicivorax TaxID=13658 RepID=A0A915KUT0_ROMCU